MKYPFDIRPKHWYEWINPFWWKRRKIALTLLNHEWEKYREELEAAFLEAILNGEGNEVSHF